MQQNATEKASTFHYGVLWFGAAVSIAEIATGMELGGLGVASFSTLVAILLGHVLGGVLLFAAGYLGARLRCNAMQCTCGAFGIWGGRFFALANLLQLLGWTAVMVAQGSDAAGALLPGISPFYLALGIGALVAAWIYIGLGTGRLGSFAIVLLLGMTLLLSGRLLLAPNDATEASSAGGSFWMVLELSVAMPLSWLPLIADYTKRASRPLQASAVSAIVYTLVSTWMYAIGFLATTRYPGHALSDILRLSGLGIAALFVVVFSTVTTTFLDAYSAGESAQTLHFKAPAKLIGVIVALLGTVLAIMGVMDRFTDFLYFIASVFAPMAAVLLLDAYLRRRTLLAAPDASAATALVNLISWVLGFSLYHILLHTNASMGATLPCMATAIAARLLACVWVHAPARDCGNAAAAHTIHRD